MRPPALVVLAGALCSAPIAPEWTRPPRSLEPQQPNDADGRYPKPDEVASPKRELSGRSSEPPPMPKLPSGNAVTNVTTALGAESEVGEEELSLLAQGAGAAREHGRAICSDL